MNGNRNSRSHPALEPRFHFIVDDVVATANFYRDKLGFHCDRFWGEPSCFAMLRSAGIIIMFKQPEITGGA